MAYVINNGAVLQLIINYQYCGQTCLNVTNWKMSGAPSGVDGRTTLTNFLGAVNNLGGMQPHLAAALVDSVSFRDVSAQWIAPTRYAYITQPPSAAAGLLANDGLPPNVALALERANDDAGKINRGDLHIGGISTLHVADGLSTGQAALDFDSFLSDIVTPVTLFDLVFTPVTNHRADPTLGKTLLYSRIQDTSRILRRRTVGLGI